jgi:hypothetical protein
MGMMTRTPIRLPHLVLLIAFLTLSFSVLFAEDTNPALPRAGIMGTVIDVNGSILSGATVTLQGPGNAENLEVVTDDNGFFMISQLQADVPYRIVVSAPGFDEWRSDNISLNAGQFKILTGAALRLQSAQTLVTVTANSEDIAIEQVRVEEQQRVFGVIPNFYVTYDHDAAPLTTKLKFHLAYKVTRDPITAAGIGFMAGVYQASGHLNYQQGMKGYGQRYGAIAADGFTDIMIGGAILPSLLHQDPRYFYQGTGTTKSRLLHALSAPFVCKGDNGHLQPNYSTMGGDLISSAVTMSYYPQSNRTAGTYLGGIAIGTLERMVSTVMQEFVLSKFTHKAADLH